MIHISESTIYKTSSYKINLFTYDKKNKDNIKKTTKELLDKIINYNDYNNYVNNDSFIFYLSLSEYTLDKIQNNFVHTYDHSRSITFDFYRNKLIFNCDKYLNLCGAGPKTISLLIENGGQIGHAIGIVIHDNTLEIIDSQHSLEYLIKNENNNMKFENFISQLKEKFYAYNIIIKNIIHASNIIPNIQDFEENTHLFLNAQRNLGNCSFWSALLMEIRVRNIHMKHNDFYNLMEKSIIPYITEKDTLFVFITKLGNIVMDTYYYDTIKYICKNIYMYINIFIIYIYFLDIYFGYFNRSS
jgi:hypothetical protein